MDYDAIVLAGGAGTRLGGVDKAEMRIGSTTLLVRTLGAVSTARQVVVVGDRCVPGHLVVQEDPFGGGPAAAIGAGVRALPDDSVVVVVLACDMPAIAAAVPVLLEALSGRPEVQGVLALDGERVQYLAGAHRVEALRAAVAARDGLDGMSVRSLLAGLELVHVQVPGGCTADVDTWEDATREGATRAGAGHE